VSINNLQINQSTKSSQETAQTLNTFSYMNYLFTF